MQEDFIFKVLFVSAYNPFEAGSGPGNGLFYLSQAIARLGCEVHILTPQSNTIGELDGVQIHFYTNPLRGKPFGNSWLFFSILCQKQISTLCEEYKINIINGRSPSTFGHALTQEPRLPFVVSVHGTSFGELRALYLAKRKNPSIIKNALITQPTWAYLTNLEYQYADCLLAVSKAVAEELVSYYHIAPEYIQVIHNGVLPVEPKETEEANILLSVGRMVWRKGFLYLIQAMPEVLKEFPDITLVLVGDGPYKPELVKCVKEMHLEKSVTFYDNMTKHELFNVYTKAKVYVQPSLYEPLCNTILEAMAYKRPVIATRVGGIPEIISDQRNGLLVDPFNSQQLASSISLLLSDDSLRKKLAEKGCQSVRASFSWEKIAAETLATYTRVINGN